jgi:sister-chromatid-cohesion protein PDS5
LLLLQLLARAFQDLGQDDNEQYTGLALHVASDVYMEHSNKDVRLLVACCIADVFRIFAPEAPYKEQEQLKVMGALDFYYS